MRLISAVLLLTLFFAVFYDTSVSQSQLQPNGIVDFDSLSPSEFAIVQYDSRPLKNYWLTAAEWNNMYCKKHGHKFIYYSNQRSCHYGEEKLADAWCKVKAMINANEDFPNVKVFVYMDSDAVVDMRFSNVSLNSMFNLMKNRLQWNPNEKPIVFNQDGPCWWCTFIMKIGYTMCLNAGTVAWYRHQKSEAVLKQWWDAAMDSYDTNPIKRKFRLKWPWEQDRQMAIYNRSSEAIQIASQPERVFMQSALGFQAEGWCLSHLPTAGCFISHYCANGQSKQVLRRLYNREIGSDSTSTSLEPPFEINLLHF